MNRHLNSDCEHKLHNSTTWLQFSITDTSRQLRRSSGSTTVILLPLLFCPQKKPSPHHHLRYRGLWGHFELALIHKDLLYLSRMTLLVSASAMTLIMMVASPLLTTVRLEGPTSMCLQGVLEPIPVKEGNKAMNVSGTAAIAIKGGLAKGAMLRPVLTHFSDLRGYLDL
jgi:hypothetical protein